MSSRQSACVAKKRESCGRLELIPRIVRNSQCKCSSENLRRERPNAHLEPVCAGWKNGRSITWPVLGSWRGCVAKKKADLLRCEEKKNKRVSRGRATSVQMASL